MQVIVNGQKTVKHESMEKTYFFRQPAKLQISLTTSGLAIREQNNGDWLIINLADIEKIMRMTK